MLRGVSLSRVTREVVTFSLFFLILGIVSGCAYVSESYPHRTPPPRPPELDTYYAKGTSYGAYTQEVKETQSRYTVKRFVIETQYGPLTIDYYERPKKSKNLIFVFPLLGGKNVIAEHFSDYFARNGYDAAIVNRRNDFKDPANFNNLEEVLRQNIVRDRIAIDFFEKEFGKSEFGTFGISRGAINVAISAGVDPRLKYNVMALGGTDLAGLFKHSHQGGIKKFIKKVQEQNHITKAQFFTFVEQTLKSDPKRLAGYINPHNTLLMLGLFDRTVPIKYGERLRRQIGNPPTVYVLADHYTSILFTQYVRLVPPTKGFCLFPMDYMESEALAFYDKKFKKRKIPWAVLPYRILQFPFNVIGRLFAS